MSKRLDNKIALITGGNSGIGLAAAERFLVEGAKVIVTASTEKSYAKAVDEIGGNFDVVKADVTKVGEIEDLIGYIKDEYGRLDVLFANAGIAHFRPLEEVDETFFDQQFNVNVKGLLFSVQKALPILSKGASVILTTSGVNTKGVPGSNVYAATKAAVRSLARSLSGELVGRGIRVNAISPGPVETPIYSKMQISQAELNQFAGEIESGTPIGRFGTPSEMAGVAAFLASDDSSYVLGSEIVADGGFSQL